MTAVFLLYSMNLAGGMMLMALNMLYFLEYKKQPHPVCMIVMMIGLAGALYFGHVLYGEFLCETSSSSPRRYLLVGR